MSCSDAILNGLKAKSCRACLSKSACFQTLAPARLNGRTEISETKGLFGSVSIPY